MSIFANNFLYAIASILDKILWAYMWLIIIRALISWVNPDPYNPIVRFLIKVTEPVLYFVRRKLSLTRYCGHTCGLSSYVHCYHG